MAPKVKKMTSAAMIDESVAKAKTEVVVPTNIAVETVLSTGSVKKPKQRIERKRLIIPSSIQHVLSANSKKVGSEVVQLRTVATHNVSIRYPLLAATHPIIEAWAEDWTDFSDTQRFVRLDQFSAKLLPVVELSAHGQEKSTLIRLDDFLRVTQIVEQHLENDKDGDVVSMSDLESESGC